MRNKLRVLLALAACLLALFVPTALADYEVNGKTIAVSGGGTAIQDAINYIDTQTDKENWTITVSDGDYHRFTVLSGMNHLTVKAADGADAAVEVCSNSDAPVATSGGFPNTAGVSIRQADHVTLEGLRFQVGTQSTPWYSAAVSNYSESTVKGNHVTVRGCSFEGAGTGIGVFINTGTPNFSIESCTFKGLKEAISMYGDGTLMKGATVSGNTMENCSFAIHGYYGGTGDAGTLNFVGNTIKGTEDTYCKIVVQDQINTGALKVNVRDNTLEHVLVGLVNLRESGEMNDVVNENSFSADSGFIEAIEPGTLEFYAAFEVPSYREGRWVLKGDEAYFQEGTNNPVGTLEYIKAEITKANAAGSTRLHLSGFDESNLIRTFTWFKDGIYWEDFKGDLKVSKKVKGETTDEEFEFTVTLGDRNINATYGDMTFVNGIASFTLSNGESVTATGMPTGLTYTVAEKKAGEYFAVSTGSTGTIEKDTIAKCEFTNYLCGDLMISKTVSGKKTDDKFAFSVTLSDKSINGTYGDVTFSSGVATFTLAHDQFVLAQNLPEGVSYTVVEDDPGAYTPTSTGSTGTIRKGETAECEFVNEPVSVAGLPTTGDDSHMALWLGCMALSLMALAAAARRWRSSRE